MTPIYETDPVSEPHRRSVPAKGDMLALLAAAGVKFENTREWTPDAENKVLKFEAQHHLTPESTTPAELATEAYRQPKGGDKSADLKDIKAFRAEESTRYDEEWRSLKDRTNVKGGEISKFVQDTGNLMLATDLLHDKGQIDNDDYLKLIDNYKKNLKSVEAANPVVTDTMFPSQDVLQRSVTISARELSEAARKLVDHGVSAAPGSDTPSAPVVKSSPGGEKIPQR